MIEEIEKWGWTIFILAFVFAAVMGMVQGHP